jgi:hypothetical protein
MDSYLLVTGRLVCAADHPVGAPTHRLSLSAAPRTPHRRFGFHPVAADL